MSESRSDSTVSPTPFSPFSTYSTVSGVTSDDAPDLGAFTTVFRALNDFNPARADSTDFEDLRRTTPTGSFAFSFSDYDSEAALGSTVWSHRPIASYLSSGTLESTRNSQSPSPLDNESAPDLSFESEEPLDTETREGEEDEGNGQPSLGFLGALDFLAAERARYLAQRDAVGFRGNSSTTSDGAWQHVVPPRRKRRRKRNRSEQGVAPLRRPTYTDGTTETARDAEDTLEAPAALYDDADDSSSSLDPSTSPQQYYQSKPATPPPEQNGKCGQRPVPPRIHQSKSTPTLRLSTTMPVDPRVLHLRTLAHKLRLLFPQDAAALSTVLSDDHLSPEDFVDPRGPVPRSQDTPVHVFIDHSNILFGLLSYIKRNYRMSRKVKHLSHAALALILERGRPVTRRVLATSSPLYQPVDSAQQLGYEVHVLRRVPDTGEGADRQHSANTSSGDSSRPQLYTHTQLQAHSHSRNGSSRKAQQRGHSHKSSLGGGNSTTESEPTSSQAVGRVRYREQGVDELLQLKIHQAIANVDEVPQNATIVLATGDGNVGEFNEEGFVGCARTALKKGWRVELYAWEGGLSKVWQREFGDNTRFQVHALDRFAMDLLET